MRVMNMMLISLATILAPALASADPAPTQAGGATTVQAAPAPAVTAQAPPATRSADADSASNPDEIVCRETPPATGSRLGGARECHTVRDWNRRQKEAESILSGSQLRGMQGKEPDPGRH